MNQAHNVWIRGTAGLGNLKSGYTSCVQKPNRPYSLLSWTLVSSSKNSQQQKKPHSVFQKGSIWNLLCRYGCTRQRRIRFWHLQLNKDLFYCFLLIQISIKEKDMTEKMVLWRFISPNDSTLYFHYKWMGTHSISFKNERPNVKLHLTRIHNYLWNLVFKCLLKVHSQLLRAGLHLVFSRWFQLYEYIAFIHCGILSN